METEIFAVNIYLNNFNKKKKLLKEIENSII